MSIRRASQTRLGRPSAVIAGATVTDSMVLVISRRQAANRFAGSRSLSISSGPMTSLSPPSPSRARAVCASSRALVSFPKVSWLAGRPNNPSSPSCRIASSRSALARSIASSASRICCLRDAHRCAPAVVEYARTASSTPARDRPPLHALEQAAILDDRLVGARVVQLAEVDLAEAHPRAQHRRHAGDRALNPILGQQRLNLDQRGAAVTALERLHDGPGLGALHDQHAVLAAHVAGRDPGVGQHHALLGGLNLWRSRAPTRSARSHPRVRLFRTRTGHARKGGLPARVRAGMSERQSRFRR
jgi:hypothetical protein